MQGARGKGQVYLSPTHHVSFSFRFGFAFQINFQKFLREGLAIELNDVAARELAAFVADGGIETLVEGGDHHLLAFFVEREAVLQLVEHLFFRLSLAEQINRRFLGPDAIRLNEVEDQRLFVIVVGVKEAEIRLEAREHAGTLNQTVEHAVAVVQNAIELVFRRLARAALKRELFRLYEAERFEINASGGAFQSAQGIGGKRQGARGRWQRARSMGQSGFMFLGNGIWVFDVEAFELVANDLDLTDINAELFLLGRALVGKGGEQLDLVLELLLHPAQGIAEPIGAGAGNKLAAADARGGAELGMPQAAKRRAKFVEKHHVDIVLDRQLQRRGAEFYGGTDKNALDFFRRDELALFFDGDVKAAVFQAQVGAGGVEDELHGLEHLHRFFWCKPAAQFGIIIHHAVCNLADLVAITFDIPPRHFNFIKSPESRF